MRKSLWLLKSGGMLCLLALALVACSDDDDPVTPDPDPKQFLPLAVDNWWLYEVTDIDSVSGELKADSKHEQRATVVAQETIEERLASIIEFRPTDDESMLDTNINSTDDLERVYQYLNLFPVDDLEIPGFPDIPLPKGWYLIADDSKEVGDEWELDSRDIPSFTLPIPTDLGTLEATISGKLVATVKKGEVQKITIANKAEEVEAQEFTITIDPQLTGRILNNDLPLQGNVVVRLWFADKVGLVQYRQEPVHLFADPGIVDRVDITRLSGELQVLVDYSVQ